MILMAICFNHGTNEVHAAMDVNWTGIIPSEVGSMASLSKSASFYTRTFLCEKIEKLNLLILCVPPCFTEIFALSGPGMDGTFPTEMGQLTQLGSFAVLLLIRVMHVYRENSC